MRDLALEREDEHFVPRRPRLEREPAHQQRGRDVVRQVSHNPHGPAFHIGGEIDGHGIARDDGEAIAKTLREFVQGSNATLVPLDRNHAFCAECEQRAGEAAWSRPDFDDGDTFERS